MADATQAQSEEFYEQYVDATVAVNCTHRPDSFHYRTNRRLVQVTIDPRAAHSQLQAQFDLALPTILEELEDGHDVVVHCQKTFHRAIVIIAALMKVVPGVDPQVYW